MNPVELVGYAAAALVVASQVMRSHVRLRALAALGGVVLGVYGALAGHVPVVVTGVALALVGLWHLRRELAPTQPMAAVPIERDAPFLTDFLAAHADDIRSHQPDYTHADADRFVRLLTREGLPAGVLVGEPAGRELLIKLDYVTPAYRNNQVARWLFGAGRATFTDAGFTRLVATAQTSVHRHYLEFLGFRPEGGSFVLDL